MWCRLAITFSLFKLQIVIMIRKRTLNLCSYIVLLSVDVINGILCRIRTGLRSAISSRSLALQRFVLSRLWGNSSRHWWIILHVITLLICVASTASWVGGGALLIVFCLHIPTGMLCWRPLLLTPPFPTNTRTQVTLSNKVLVWPKLI